ncbi:MAG TPA: PspC domain-containing protein [Streptosporangiaceae bacterium]|nr:PspC domain-containing protein [Streptosporangiaceae bacterium]
MDERPDSAGSSQETSQSAPTSQSPDTGQPGCQAPWPSGRRRSDRWLGRGWEFDWHGSARTGPQPRRAGVWPRDGGPLRRQQEDRLAGGVATGISLRTGIGVNAVRTAFVITSLISGFGAAVYVLAWLFVPADGESGNIASRAQADRRGIGLAAAAASALALVLLIAALLHVGWIGSLSWPPVIALAGLVLIWRNASPAEQAVLRRLSEPLLGDTSAGQPSRRGLRITIAAVLIIAGLVILLSEHLNRLDLRPLAGVALMFAAIVVLLGPWWLRIARDLMAERQARIRAEERAEMASRVHDSVLQTLALIQRRADDPQQVVSLARAQERELRSWLFDGRAPGSLDGLATTLAGGVRLIQQDVEAQHGIVVEAISVGDCELDADLSALLAAAREATVNAAKWSGASAVTLFAEVEPDAVSVFVRDRGRGFDPDAVPEDRKGLAESVHARMARRGGSATVRSAPGKGTEVALTMPRTAGQREPSPAT